VVAEVCELIIAQHSDPLQVPVTLNFPISYFRAVAIFIIVNTQKLFHTECVATLVIYIHKRFHLPPWNVPLVIRIILKASDISHDSHIAVLYSTTINRRLQ
jgi:uncharacterized membrane protein